MKTLVENFDLLDNKTLCRLVCEQAGFEVFVNNEKVQVEASGFLLLDKNTTYSISVRKSGYEDFCERFVSSQSLSFIYVNLKKRRHLHAVLL
ncbi:MAG: hypothetical protein ACLGGX_11125 [Bdellovibrionia bacterium]